ncbi:MAG: DUF4339 domain-containing protein [Solobacterium sp.]|nr:DUF4339 domain-containing protein [Solobacterium sp.]MBR3127977.1 DUF4339 domain-containing protein [Solobacterium sp.]
MNKVWYYTLDGSEKPGPFSDDELVRLIQQKIVTADHYIWMVDLASWIPVRDSIYAFYLSEDPFRPENAAEEQE